MSVTLTPTGDCDGISELLCRNDLNQPLLTSRFSAERGLLCLSFLPWIPSWVGPHGL